MKRSSGILLPVFSLPSPYGIGTLGQAAYQWVDFLARAGQRYWQVLPLGPTGYGDSPYQSFSVFAGNPYFIDPDRLVQEGWLTAQECQAADCSCPAKLTEPPEAGSGGSAADFMVNYADLYVKRYGLLLLAYRRFERLADPTQRQRFAAFCADQADWLADYALYFAIKRSQKELPWTEWPQPLRLREPAALAQARAALQESVNFCSFMQFKFYEQWQNLKSYAHQAGLSLIGDLPIYAALDSADVWTHRELFQLDETARPLAVAGCPPDGFSADGQLWGNPLYRWDVMAQDGYAWWLRRLQQSFDLCDVLRIDHFRGLESYYAIPFGEETARQGRWVPGPGRAFVDALKQRFPHNNVIAEDLGFLTDEVRDLLAYSGFPGMKVLEFAFDRREKSDYLPYNYNKNCVVYTGTHDNATLAGWLQSADPQDAAYARRYLGTRRHRGEHWDFIRLAQASVADLAVIPLQDYLGLGNEARINTPSTLGGNWRWRLPDLSALSPQLARQIARLTDLYGRGPVLEHR